jgi:type III secretory pathway component EscR
MDAIEGVQSFNFEVGQKFKSFKEFESQLKHYLDAKVIQMYRRSSCKIESTKTKQTITNNDLVVDLPTKILDENINLHRIKQINSRLWLNIIITIVIKNYRVRLFFSII